MQEICDLRVGDIRLEHPASVRITGKGRKTRTVPILPTTTQNLKSYLTENCLLAPEKSQLPFFPNRYGNALTRAGLSYILNKYVKAASENGETILERISPHILRHTKAMHIYESGNNLIYVRDFLGHNDVKTTEVYAHASLDMKLKALEKVSDSPVLDIPSWVQNKDMLSWLKSFGTQKG